MAIKPKNTNHKYSTMEFKNNLKLGKVVPIGLGVIACLNLITAVVHRHSINTINKSMVLVNNGLKIKSKLQLIEKQVVDAETGQRGFLYTLDPNYLDPYEKAITSIDVSFENIKKLIVDHNQLNRLQEIEKLTGEKIAELRQTIELQNSGKAAETKALVMSGLGKSIMSEIRKKVAEMEIVEDRLIYERESIVVRAEQQAKNITTGSALAIFVVVCIMIWFILRQTIKPIEHVSLTISSSASQIATTVEEHERIANEQAVSVNQTTATMDELGASSRQAATQAEAASMNVEQLMMLSIGENTTKNTISTNDFNLKAKSRQIAREVIELSEKLTQIDRIAGVVSQLASQTNMLALNAAVGSG